MWPTSTRNSGTSLADWERNDDDTYTYYGYGRCIKDKQLKSILMELVAGVQPTKVAEDRRLPLRAVMDIYNFFYKKMQDE